MNHPPIPEHLSVEHPFAEPGTFINCAKTSALVARIYSSDCKEFDTEAVAALFARSPQLLECLKEATLRERAHAACCQYEADCGHEPDHNRLAAEGALAAVAWYERATEGL